MNQAHGKHIGVLGSGSWGAALSTVLCGSGHHVTLWSNSENEAKKIERTRRLIHKLPDIVLPEAIHVTTDSRDFVEEAEILVVAVPSKVIRSFARTFSCLIHGKDKIVVVATKGMDAKSLETMSEIIEKTWKKGCIRGVAVLSGPSHAEEVALGMPTAIVSASSNLELAEEVQAAFQTSRFRVYTNEDRRGVEIGAALKNIIAIAVGISDGLGFGDNARAALISRSVQELGRAGKVLGAQPETFAGLSGIGDLVVTCTSKHSRNRKFGELVARGYSIHDAEEEVGMVVEGVSTVLAVPELKQRCQCDLPILEEVYSIVKEQANPQEAVERLMLRESKSEL